MRTYMLGVIVALGSIAVAASGAQSKPYKVLKRFPVAGATGWDYLYCDSKGKRLFVSRGTHAVVINTADGSVSGDIPDTAGIHGFAFAPALGLGFTSNGAADSVGVFDSNTLKPTGSIPVNGHNPDAILYDEFSKTLMTFNGRSHDVSFIDPVSRRVTAVVPVGGKPEFAATDGAGHVFVNIEDTSKLVTLDPVARKVTATWPLPHCEEPSGLAMDVEHHRLFSACGNGRLAVTDSQSGTQVASVPIGQGPDAVVFDRERQLIFTPNGEDGTLTVIHQDTPDHYSVTSTVATQKSARTLALDDNTHHLYLVAAEFGPPPAATGTTRPRPPVLEGTFKVLVVGNDAP